MISGHGWCGRGVATRAKGHGAHVIICKVDPPRALEAVMDGFTVMPIAQAASIGDFFCALTGDIILTGTPHGVGAFRKPAVYLRTGDKVEVEIERIGCLSNVCESR